MKLNLLALVVALSTAIYGTASGAIESSATVSSRSPDNTTSPLTQPNIVLIVADDMDYADILDQRRLAPTPHIDSIAKNGVRFSSAYVTSPVCGPSRVGILTGQYHDKFGFATNHGPEIPDNFGLPTTATLISETLKKAGYATAMVGKWHLGFDPGKVPNDQGFDEFFGHLHGAHDYRPGVEKPGPILRNEVPVKTTQYLTREFGSEAADFIWRHREKSGPYFLYVPFNAVHGPLQAPPETLQKFKHHKKKNDRLMAAMMHELDQAVGKILRAVEDSGQLEKTLIVFTNDNGGVGGNNPHANGELRGGKAILYEGGIRVPMLMQWKGTLPAGKTFNSMVSTMDLAPTFVAAAGLTSNTITTYDGVNLLPFINNVASSSNNQSLATEAPHDILFWHFVDAHSQKAVRKGQWKAVQMADGKKWELYNLAEDIGEQNDLARQYPERLAEMRREWRQWQKNNPPPAWLDSRILRKRQKTGH